MMKRCYKCKEWKDRSEFPKDKSKKGGYKGICKKCLKQYNKQWYEENKECIKQRSKQWYEKNKEHAKQYRKQWYKENKECIKQHSKQWYEKNKEHAKQYNESNKEHRKQLMKQHRNSSVLYHSKSKYRWGIELYEEIKESRNGNLMCKCAYCGGWFEPTYLQIRCRVQSINSMSEGEQRLYCSKSCKDNCPIYRQHLYSKDQKPATSREVQPELRQMVFERDNYTCQKCNTHRDDLEIGIHCHHKEGILWEPLQSADMDMCITLCENCHKEAHEIDGCGYNDLKCA